jgi:sialate O-acetylesterase
VKSVVFSFYLILFSFFGSNVIAQTFVTVYSENFESIADGTQITDIGFSWWGNESAVTQSSGNGANGSSGFISSSDSPATIGILKEFTLETGKQYRFNQSVKLSAGLIYNPLRISSTTSNNLSYYNQGQTSGTGSWEVFSSNTFTVVSGEEEIGVYTVKVNNSGNIHLDNIKLEIEGIAWTGAVSNNWHDSGNWEGGTVPTEDDHVLVANVSNLPVISDQLVKVKSLEIADGASLLVQNSITVIVNGQLTGDSGFIQLLPGSVLFAERIVGDNHIIPEFGNFSINSVFQSHMVLQRDKNISVYGKASDGLPVTVEFAGQSITTTAVNGNWEVSFSPISAGGPYTLTITGTDTFVFDDILMGDVWICGGQSNMAQTIQVFKNRPENFTEFQNVPGTYQNDNIRLMTVKVVESNTPEDDVQIQRDWSPLSPATSLNFSATGYFFGKSLQPEINVPIGLITVARGGTGMGSFMPIEAINANPNTQNYNYANIGLSGPSTLYNSMVHPLTKQAITGVIWYQGEHETIQFNDLSGFSSIFADMINSWRNAWGQPNAPFIFTQLPGWGQVNDQPVDLKQSTVRQQQLDTWNTVPNTGMAVSIDGGMTLDVHPPNKEDVGNRLALFARKMAYAEDIIYSGPKIREAVRVTQTDKAILKFKHFANGLESRAITLDPYGPTPYNLVSDSIYGFEVAGIDNVFHNATAVIENDSIITVTSINVPEPAKVRFGWKAFPFTNLFNDADLPASPFEMDVLEVMSDNSLSTSDFVKPEDNYFTVFPTYLNSGEFLNLKNKFSTPFVCEIRDALGRLKAKHQSQNGKEISISSDELSAGLYFVILKSNEENEVKKIIIR